MQTQAPPASQNGAKKSVKGDEEFHIDAMDSAAFSRAKFTRDWLINGMLVRHQAGVIGGPKKSLKTSLLVDMAISIGSGTPFLDHFQVPTRRRVAVFSGESDSATLQDLAQRVCRARGVSLSKCLVHWSFSLPHLSVKSERLALRQFLQDNKIKVVFIDPLYLCLLDGSRSVSASNLYEIGPLLWDAAQTCLDAGATPFFVHHATKSGAKRSTDSIAPLNLDDLAFAGIGEFARQWILVRPLEPFNPEVGRHRLVLTTGGSAGHSGIWEVTVDEGTLREDFSGRKWAVKVGPLAHDDDTTSGRSKMHGVDMSALE